MADRDPKHLHPQVRDLLEEHERRARWYGLFTRQIETYRDEAGQLAAYMKGRDAAGNVIDPRAVVTNAKPGESYHGLVDPEGNPASQAYHLALVTPGGDLVVGTQDDGLAGFGRVPLDPVWIALYDVLALIGESLGLTAGARWQSRDYTHFERRVAGMKLAQLRDRVAAGNPILIA